MDNLSIEKFSPQKAELQTLADKYKSLTINGPDDTAGYNIVNEARKDLAHKRSAITNIGKDLRREAIDFQKKVIETERGLIAIIEPVELELKAKKEAIDQAKLRAERVAVLPSRKEKLATIGVVVEDDFLLGINTEKFNEFFNEKNTEFLAEKERKLEEEAKRLAREKEIEDAKKKAREEAEEKAKEDARRAGEEAKIREEKIKADAEEAQKKAVKEAEEKAEKEKQAIIDEQKKKDEAEEAKKKAKEEEMEKLDKQKKFQKFLLDNGFTDEAKKDFHLLKVDNEVVLYKKIAVFSIK